MLSGTWSYMPSSSQAHACALRTHVCVCVCVHVCFTFLARIHSGNLSRKERVNVAIIRDKLIPDM